MVETLQAAQWQRLDRIARVPLRRSESIPTALGQVGVPRSSRIGSRELGFTAPEMSRETEERPGSSIYSRGMFVKLVWEIVLPPLPANFWRTFSLQG